jgi:hypothetical protein
MAVTRLTTNGLTGTKYDIASADNYYMEPIATTLLGSTATTITFSNIPQGYKNLQIRAIAKASGSNFNPKMQFNGDTTSSYSWHYIYGDGSTAIAGAGATQSFIYNSIISTNASMYNGFVIDILDYTNISKFKTTKELSGQDRNGSGEIALWSGNWRNTSPITSITFSNGTFDTNSRFSLYGIKG